MSWNKTIFENLYSIESRNGLTKPSKIRGFGFKMINMGELFANDRIFDIPMEMVPLNEKEKQSAKVEKDDLLFARQSLVLEGAGKCSIVMDVSPLTVFESHIIRVRLNKEKGIPLFYYYYFKSPFSPIKTIVSQCAQAGIRGSELQKLEVVYPPKETQQRIADILSSYDDLIENNQKQIKLLEEAAQRLYKEWFVDLHFPGYENTPIIDGVPDGWNKVTLDTIAPIVTGKKDANFGTPDGKYLFFTCAQEPIKAPSYSFDCNAVILAGNGDFNVKLYRGQFEAYQRTYVFSPYESKHLYLLYHAVRESMRQLFQGASGSTIKFLTRHMLEDIAVFVPDKDVLNAFNNICDVIQQKIERLKAQIMYSQEARDRLLPKLMSGEIEVFNNEQRN